MEGVLGKKNVLTENGEDSEESGEYLKENLHSQENEE